jgi:type I restriction enzyme M protein
VRPLLPKENFIFGDALTCLVPFWGTFDLVIGNPPFSAQANLEKRPEILQGYDLGFGRQSQCLEVLFLELFFKLAKPKGKIAIILPDGPLSNRPYKYVRDWLLCRAHVEAIVSLPRGIFNKTAAKTNLLVARKLPPAAQPYREPTALFICEDVSALRPIGLRKWQEVDGSWQTAVLADKPDWRPEAQHVETPDNYADTFRLGDVFRLRTGFALYGKQRKLYSLPGPNRVLLLRAKNFAPGGGLRLDKDCAYIDRNGDAFCEESLVCPGEVLFVRVGAGCYGRTSVVPPGLNAQADDWIHILTPLAPVDVEGLVAWFNSHEGLRQIRRLAKGVGTLSISKASLAELRIPKTFVRSNDLVLADQAPRYRINSRRIGDDRGGKAVPRVPIERGTRPFRD